MHIQTALNIFELGLNYTSVDGPKMKHTTFLDYISATFWMVQTDISNLFWVITSDKSPARDRISFQRRLPGAHEDINLISRKGNETAKNEKRTKLAERGHQD